jgi:hypothetical protein
MSASAGLPWAVVGQKRTSPSMNRRIKETMRSLDDTRSQDLHGGYLGQLTHHFFLLGAFLIKPKHIGSGRQVGAPI